MLSVLIPTYNYDVTFLVKQLYEQLENTKINYEIIVQDDGSKSKHNINNDKLNKLKHVTFKVLPTNVGLAQNRNVLAKTSQYDYVLFIDGDSILINNMFIKTYLNAIKSKVDIIYGGTLLPSIQETNKRLRSLYSIKRENLKANKRSKNSYKNLRFNNTLINKACFNTIKFDSNITEYGHEDTLFAYYTSLKHFKVIHIDNAIQHGDIDVNEVFISKTCNALKNLNFLYKNSLIDSQFVRFLKGYDKIKKLKLNYFLAFSFKAMHPFFKWQLQSSNPSLFVFDCFRLSYFSYINLKS